MAVTNACGALFGTSNYVNAWLQINFLVVIVGFVIAGAVYAFSRFFPGRSRAAAEAMTKVEITQLFISVFVIFALLALSSVACNFSLSLSGQLTGVQQSPFMFSENYIANLSTNTGLKLLTYIYSVSIAYSMDAQAISLVSRVFSQVMTVKAGPVSFGINVGQDLAVQYTILSAFYMTLFSPLVVIAVGMLFMQLLILPVIQAAAFTVVLPTALVLRSIIYGATGNAGLRDASNAVLSIAIALYIIYPLTIGMDAYIMHWMYSSKNPSLTYLNTEATFNAIPESFFSKAASATTQKYHSSPGFGATAPPINTLLSDVVPLGLTSLLGPFVIPEQANFIVVNAARFFFMSIFLFALNLAITIAFAQSLTKALNAGIEGTVSFWNNL